MKVIITNEAWERILEYAQSAYTNFKSEIGGMAIVHRIDDDPDEPTFLIDEPSIVKQEISGGNCVLDKDALAEYYAQTAIKHKDKKDLSFLWWHSHHTMGAFWSGTDLTAIDEFNNGTYSFSLVVNLKREYLLRVSVWSPVEVHQDIKLEKRTDTSDVDNEVKALCEEPATNNYSRVWYQNGRPVSNPDQLQLYKNQIVINADDLPTDGWGHKQIIVNDDSTDNLESGQQLAAVLDQMISSLCDGSLKPKKFKKTVKQLNRKLEMEDHPWRIGELTVPELKMYDVHLEGEDLLYPKEEEFENNVVEMLDYNKSYGSGYGGRS